MSDNKLPETVYVTRIADDNDEEFTWLSIEEDVESLAVKDEVRVVGVYKLVQTVEVELEVTERVIANVVPK